MADRESQHAQQISGQKTEMSSGTLSEDVTKFRSGDYKYLLSHPEDILKKAILDVLCSDHWQGKVSHVFIDEAHCVVQWGTDFRPEFRNIYKLRAVFPDAIIVALTATATKEMVKEITSVLYLKSPTTVTTSVDRPNVKINVFKRLPSAGGQNTANDSFYKTINPFILELCEKREEFPKTIIYTKLKWCGEGYNFAFTEAQCHDNPQEIMECVSQYHSPCSDEMKKVVMDDMGDVAAGKIRLLFATEAYGMGADVPNVRRILHFGPPSAIETYVQEIGRGGRDGLPSEAIMFYNNNDLGSVSMRQEVKDLCRSKTCRRLIICSHFGWEVQSREILHTCCDICATECNCIQCVESILSKEEDEDKAHEVKCISNDQKNLLEATLLSYFEAENNVMDMPHPEFYTGLTTDLIKILVENCINYSSEEDVLHQFRHLDVNYISNIYHIIQTIRIGCSEC